MLTLFSGFWAILRFSRKKNSTVDISVSDFGSFHSIISYSFQDFRMLFAAFYSQLNCAKTSGNIILNFWLKKFWHFPKVENNLGKNRPLTSFGAKKSKFCLHLLFCNLVVTKTSQTAFRYLETCRKRWISREHAKFSQDWQPCKLGVWFILGLFK